jgi:hypothetical protein
VKDRQYNEQVKKDKRTDNTMNKWKRTKGQTIQWTSEKGQKDRQYNEQVKKHKRTKYYLQNTTQKTKDRATRTLLKTADELRCSGRAGSSCSILITFNWFNWKRHNSASVR